MTYELMVSFFDVLPQNTCFSIKNRAINVIHSSFLCIRRWQAKESHHNPGKFVQLIGGFWKFRGIP